MSIKPGYIVTQSGIRFYPFDPKIEDIALDDIARALSRICRFVGHTKDFYSVAQHSVNVANILLDDGQPAKIQFAGLMHDACEAYLGDVATPIKRMLPEFNAAEEFLWRLIVMKFDIQDTEGAAKIVKGADMVAFHVEARDLMNDPPEWRDRPSFRVLDWKIRGMDCDRAYIMFLEKFKQLQEQITGGA